MKDLYFIVGLTKSGALTDEQRETLELGLRTLAKKAGLDRRPRNSEKSRDVARDSQNGDGGADSSATEQVEPGGKPGEKPDGNSTASGHGRNGANAYGGATRCRVPRCAMHTIGLGACRGGFVIEALHATMGISLLEVGQDAIYVAADCPCPTG